MSRNYLAFLIVPLCVVEFSFSDNIADCRVVVGGTTECNQYSTKLIRAKEIAYDLDTKKLIVSKTLPVPTKTKVKVISVADMIEKYVKVEDSLRFKSSHEKALKVIVVKEIISKEKIEEKIKEIKPIKVIVKQEKTIVEKEIVSKNIIEEKFKEKKPIKDIVKQEKTIVEKEEVIVIKPKETHSLPIKKPKKTYAIYTVVSGDVLSTIAHKFGLSTKELLILNNLDKKLTLKIGQKFKIPLAQKKVDAITSAEYTIESGDTLLSIAYMFDIEPKDLVSFNDIKSSTIIHKGKKLSLPLPHVIKKLEAKKKRLALKKAAEIKKKKLKKKRQAKLKIVRGFGKRKLRVTATAYSSHKGQTDSTPFLAAWNNRLRPGMKIIAVSRDMLTRYGMQNGTKVRIAGLSGYYRVRDKMNKRYRKRIDIYMGLDRRRALRWGRRSVVIYW